MSAWSRVRTPLDRKHLRTLDAYFSFYAGIPNSVHAAKVPNGIYIHDLIPFLYPQHVSDQQRRVLARILRSIRPGSLVVVNSLCTKRDVATRLGLNLGDIVVVPLAADTATFHPVTDAARIAGAKAQYGLPDGRYTLTLHSAAPHKNMPRLLRSHAAYRAQRGPEAVPLVIAGGKGDPKADILASGKVSPKDLEGVVFAGFVDDDDLAPLYSGAEAFFFPSLYEGFGLPVLEALLCGVPAFVADAASLPEVMAPLPQALRGPDRLLDPEDDSAWTAAFLRAEQAAHLTPRDIAPLHETFSWSRSGQALTDAIRAHVHKYEGTASR